MRILHKAKKSLGQNFLFDKNIISKIVNIANISKEKTVVDIGAGQGSLTNEIALYKPKKILAIEKDKKLVAILNKNFSQFDNVQIINKDILNTIKDLNRNKNVIVFGNLPYNISTKILTSLIMLKKWPPWYDILILMFQKEVADRILAKSKTKEFNRLSVLSNWRLDIKKHFDVSNNCFFPKPKISSTVLSFKPKKNNQYELKNPKSLETVTRILFSNRRKMINKNFNKLFRNNKSIVNRLKINLKNRPEELSNDMFYNIARLYEELFN